MCHKSSYYDYSCVYLAAHNFRIRSSAWKVKCRTHSMGLFTISPQMLYAFYCTFDAGRIKKITIEEPDAEFNIHM